MRQLRLRHSRPARTSTASGSQFCFLGLALTFAACDSSKHPAEPGDRAPPILTATTLGEQAVQSAAQYLEAEPYASADRERGARLAQMCRACHTVGRGEPAMLGPNLHGMFGRRAGSQGGFAYSPAFREVDFAWTPRALDAWLAEPAHFLPGNRMSFTGLPDEADRASLIAHLLDVTQ